MLSSCVGKDSVEIIEFHNLKTSLVILTCLNPVFDFGFHFILPCMLHSDDVAGNVTLSHLAYVIVYLLSIIAFPFHCFCGFP